MGENKGIKFYNLHFFSRKCRVQYLPFLPSTCSALNLYSFVLFLKGYWGGGELAQWLKENILLCKDQS